MLHLTVLPLQAFHMGTEYNNTNYWNFKVLQTYDTHLPSLPNGDSIPAESGL